MSKRKLTPEERAGLPPPRRLDRKAQIKEKLKGMSIEELRKLEKRLKQRRQDVV